MVTLSTLTETKNDRVNEIKLVLESVRKIMLEEERKKPISSKYKISSTIKFTLGGTVTGVIVEGTLILNNVLKQIQEEQLVGTKELKFNIWDAIEETLKKIQEEVNKLVEKIKAKAEEWIEEIKKEALEKIGHLYREFLKFIADHPDLASGGLSGYFTVPEIFKIEVSLKFEKK